MTPEFALRASSRALQIAHQRVRIGGAHALILEDEALRLIGDGIDLTIPIGRSDEGCNVVRFRRCLLVGHWNVLFGGMP